MGMAAAVIGAGALGAVGTAVAASSAAEAQQNAAAQSSATQRQMYEQTRRDLTPYNQAGQQGMNMLMGRMGEFTSPIIMDQAALERTPGYQFNLSQGLKAVQNSAAARGLGVSGAAMKGAAQYATGLADSTYQNQFNNAVTNQTNAYNRLMGVSTLGQSAAAQTGAMGTQTAANIGNNIVGAGNATAGSYMAMGNAVGGLANSLGQAYMMSQIMGGYGGA